MLYLCTRKTDEGSSEWALSSAGSERLPYKQRVGGSNPSSPTDIIKDGSLAQLNRASDYGSEGCRFESCRSHTQRTGKKGKDGHTRLFFLFLYTLHTTSGHQTQDVQGRIGTRFATWTLHLHVISEISSLMGNNEQHYRLILLAEKVKV